MSGLLSLAEAQERLVALASPMPVVSRPVGEVAGLWLAEPLSALRTQPAYPLSAMDGWAVRQADFPGPFHIAGESAAGHPRAAEVRGGEAVRISTGAIVPAGADVVIVQEDCHRDGDTLYFEGDPPRPLGRHIRHRGLDFTEGQAVLSAGDRMTPARVALAIGAGHAHVPVRMAPSVAIVDSGDELRAPGEALGPGDIPASNGPMLSAMLAPLGCFLSRLGPVADRREALASAFQSARHANVLLTSGGASVGDHDLVRPVLEDIGAEIDFWRVAIKPGKPIMIGRRDGQIIVGLPGNPVSSFVTAILFALPLVRAMMGARMPFPPTEQARSAQELPKTGKRAEFLRARLGDGMATLVKVQDSGALLPLANADALIVRPPGSRAVAMGESVRVIRLASP